MVKSREHGLSPKHIRLNYVPVASIKYLPFQMSSNALGKGINMAVEAAPMEVFDGVMLGDGHIHDSHDGTGYLDIRQSGEEHFDWLNDIKVSLSGLGLNWPADSPKMYKAVSRGKEYKNIVLRSLSSSMLGYQRHRWYKDGKKAVPDDFIITSVTLANWFMGDGTSLRLKKRPNVVRVRFCTDAFSYPDVQRLCRLLAKLGIASYPELQRPGQYRVCVIGIPSVSAIMYLVKPYVVQSFVYKMKMPWKVNNYPARRTRRTTRFSALREKLRR